MVVDPGILFGMILRIAEFFRYMSDNEKRRLYYVIPLQYDSPYAYQHSSIRDVGTICDILDLVQFFKEGRRALEGDTLFEEVARILCKTIATSIRGMRFLTFQKGI